MPKPKKFKAKFLGNTIISEDKEAKNLYSKSRFGEPKEGKIQYSLVEGLYLFEKKLVNVLDWRNKKITLNGYIRKAKKLDANFWIRYIVFRDMRNRGYIVKTALKFGADFRVYDRGIKPGDGHAKWIVYPVHENSTLTWYEFSAKNRVAHSTRKNLLLGIVDDENDVTYYTVEWTKS
ncbi:tRNA-intron lyase [archaeon]|nr:tRNA-intron lyase [archaeon]